MFHLETKDHFFLFFIALAVGALGLAFFLVGNNVDRSRFYESRSTAREQTSQINNTGVFDCNGNRFEARAGIRPFDYAYFPDINAGIEEECFWVSVETVPQYRFAYMKVASGKKVYIDEILAEKFAENKNMISRNTSQGTEVNFSDPSKSEYGVALFATRGQEIYLLGYYSTTPVDFSTPDFRLLADSFRPLN